MDETAGDRNRTGLRGERLASAIGVAAVHGAIGAALLVGLGARMAQSPETTVQMFDVRPAAMPPPPPMPPPAAAKQDGSAAPALAAARALIVVPEPVIAVDLRSPVAAAPVAGAGAEGEVGAGATAGPGAGDGGSGEGNGSGEGAGSGSRTRRVAGVISPDDYPRAAVRARAEGTSVARLAIGADGRVAACTIRLSSGNAALDAATCRLILRRFRFTPARDARGAAIADTVEWEQVWTLREEEGPAADEARCRAEASGLATRRDRTRAVAACMAAKGWTR